MRMEYTNPPLNTTTLLSNLQNEGLVIMDERKAFAFLENVSYFRFAAYLRPLKSTGMHVYKENATFEKAVRLYEFDAKLRTLLFSAIQKTVKYVHYCRKGNWRIRFHSISERLRIRS